MPTKRKPKIDNSPEAVAARQLQAAKRLLRLRKAHDSLLDFTAMSMPDPEDPDNPDRSRYTVRPHHKFIASRLEDVVSGKTPWLILNVPPRMGKSELVSRRLPAWLLGRDPYTQMIVTSYGEDLSMDFGREVRSIMTSPFYQQVFPGTHLRTGSRSADRLQTLEGGMAYFVGMGGAVTGRGADCVVPYCTVYSNKGIIPISQVAVGDYVRAFNHRTGKRTWAVVQAVQAKRTGKPLVSLGELRCTSDHRVYACGKGYVPASEFNSLSPLWWQESTGRDDLHVLPDGTDHGASELRSLRGWVREKDLGASESGRPGGGRKPEDVLQQGVLPGLPESAPTATCDHGDLPHLWGSDHTGEGAGKPGSAGPEVLLDRVLPQAPGEPPFERGVRGVFPAPESGSGGKGQALPNVPRDAESEGYPSHRPQPGEQYGREPDPALRSVPSQVSRTRGTCADDLAGLLQGPGEYVVDIQTETGNFFCEGVLVHNCLIIDDPIKGRVEANSRTLRNQQWDWFTDVGLTRLMGAGRVIVCMTRWHEDDLVGRITNPRNPYYDPQFASNWKVINIPHFAEEDDPLWRDPGEILWPERTSREFLENQRRINPSGFSALHMGRPSPPEGDFFKAKDIRTYSDMSDLPRNLRYYAASDHAISLEQKRDATCMGVIGLDSEDNIWVLPDLVWRQLDAEAQVDSMLNLMRVHKPLFWWAEKGHISKAIGPFLRKRMLEEKVYCSLIEKTPSRDKQTRAQAIQGRMSMGKVFFPKFAHWWPDAKDQLLNFPHTQHDDFVDFLAWIGTGLSMQVPATPTTPKVKRAQPGSIQWIMASAERIRARKPEEHRYLR